MIAVWWIGDSAQDEPLLEEIRVHAAREFEIEAVIHDGRERPIGTYDVKRRQHSSREMLQWLVSMSPPGAARVLGVTDVDLFMPVLTFVFGEAQLSGQAAVLSTARLADWASPERSLARAVKECVHELGHTFGLTHCSMPGCVMTRSTNVEAVDRKRPSLCDECRARYGAALQDGLHV